MKFILEKERQKFWDKFKSPKKGVICCRTTLLDKLGIEEGFKTKYECHEDISEDFVNFVKSISNIDSQDTFPLNIPSECLEDYILRVSGKTSELKCSKSFLKYVYNYLDEESYKSFKDCLNKRKYFSILYNSDGIGLWLKD
jgi:hypothetical protein